MGAVARRGVIAAGTAWAGLVLGHLLAYAVAYPDDGIRQAHLAATGHGWLDLVTLSLLAVIPAVVVLTSASALRGRPAGVTWSRIAALQVPAFLLIEVAERGSAIGGAFSDPAVLLGIAVQLVVAAAAALLLRAVAAIVVAAVRTRRVRTPARTAPPPVLHHLVPPYLVHLVRSRRRAPPVPIGA
jgi:hypothetical protein